MLPVVVVVLYGRGKTLNPASPFLVPTLCRKINQPGLSFKEYLSGHSSDRDIAPNLSCAVLLER